MHVFKYSSLKHAMVTLSEHPLRPLWLIHSHSATSKLDSADTVASAETVRH